MMLIETSLGYNLNIHIDIANNNTMDFAILAHGYLLNSTFPLFQDFVNQKIMNTIRLDFHGAGQSGGDDVWNYSGYWDEVEDIREVKKFAEKVGLRITTLIGHSRGADDVLLYASKYNDIPTIIQIAGRYDIPGTAWNLYEKQLNDLDTKGFFDVTSADGHYHKITTDDVNARSQFDMSHLGEMSRVKRFLSIHGTKDNVIPVDDVFSFAKTIENPDRHSVAIITDSNHFFPQKYGTEVLHILKNYLNGNADSRILTAHEAIEKYAPAGETSTIRF